MQTFTTRAEQVLFWKKKTKRKTHKPTQTSISAYPPLLPNKICREITNKIAKNMARNEYRPPNAATIEADVLRFVVKSNAKSHTTKQKKKRFTKIENNQTKDDQKLFSISFTKTFWR